ncbi:type I-E CRISPR-associated protein Cse1/CasA [Streptomyces californicus]|uniref:type I-E CRISPR-associated protein Cse1/CasA n=1 Tax=Streptomyces californicus TaxID=67351 RepID=UPI00380B83D2
MPSPFTVAEDPWIPVRIRTDLTADERAELLRLLPEAEAGRHLVGLRTLFSAAHLIADLDLDYPPVESVLRRMLAAGTARVTGLDTGTADGWLDTRDDVLTAGRFSSQAVNAYFDEHAPRFALYDTPRPFLQDPRLSEECTGVAPPGRLAMNRASGNNPVWADHTPETAPLTMPDAASWLLAWHGYGPAGMGAVRTHAGRSTKSCKAGPYRCLISYFPHDPTSLFTTLIASVPAPAAWPTNPGNDHAPWETDTLPDPLHPPAPAGLISLLTSRTAHATLLTPRDDGRQVTGCRVVWGTATDLPTAIDPYVVDRDKGGPLRADRTRAVFRDLDALLLKHRPGSKIAVRRPTVFDSIADLPPHILTTLGIRALGWHQDKQDKNFGWYAATTPPVCHYLEERDPDGAAALATLRAHTEATASDLYKALATAWYALNPRRKEDERAAFTTPAITRFYALAEPEFWKIAENPAQRPTFKRTAISVFDTATATMATTVRTMDAVAKARAKLTNPSKRR